MRKNRFSKNSGFSLLEVAAVMVIGGLLLGSFSAALTVYMKKSAINTTKTRMAAIDEAVRLYKATYGKFPCPAPYDAAPDTAAYGREVDVNCSAAPVAGSTVRSGAGATAVRIGAVPVRSLNLPDQIAGDAWGSRFTYAVTEVQARHGSFATGAGQIDVQDSNNNSVVNPPGRTDYVIVSHGPDLAGAYSLNGISSGACVTTALDGQNCNNDSIFRKTILLATGSTSHFDDQVLFSMQEAQAIPAGAVMAFDAAACPDGWIDLPNAAGRVVVGVGTYSETGTYRNQYTASRVTSSWTNNKTYTLGELGGHRGSGSTDGTAGTVITPVPDTLTNADMSAFIALRYCKKK